MQQEALQTSSPLHLKKTRVRYSVVYFPVRKKKRDRGKKKKYNKLETENSDNVYIYI